jgi:Transposase domain (DUF772)
LRPPRRLEREAQRNVELMWLTGRLAPDFKTIANFRRHNGEAIRLVCREFVMLCRKLNLLAGPFGTLKAWMGVTHFSARKRIFGVIVLRSALDPLLTTSLPQLEH